MTIRVVRFPRAVTSALHSVSSSSIGAWARSDRRIPSLDFAPSPATTTRSPPSTASRSSTRASSVNRRMSQQVLTERFEVDARPIGVLAFLQHPDDFLDRCERRVPRLAQRSGLISGALRSSVRLVRRRLSGHLRCGENREEERCEREPHVSEEAWRNRGRVTESHHGSDLGWRRSHMGAEILSVADTPGERQV